MNIEIKCIIYEVKRPNNCGYARNYASEDSYKLLTGGKVKLGSSGEVIPGRNGNRDWENALSRAEKLTSEQKVGIFSSEEGEEGIDLYRIPLRRGYKGILFGERYALVVGIKQ